MWPLYLTLLGIGLFGSFLSGLLGIGGAAWIIPMLLYVPALLGTGHLGIREATGLSMVLVLVSSLSGAVAQWRHGLRCPRCMTMLAPAIAAGSLVGGLVSGMAPAQVLTAVFATMALLAGLVMLWPRPRAADEPPPGAEVDFPPALGVGLAAAVGLVSGLIGAGGAFILVPLMIYVLKVPTRLTLAASLGIVFVSALAGTAGKAAAGQIPWELAGFLVAGAVPGAQAGAWFSRRVHASTLRHLLAVLITSVAVRIWWDLLL